MEYHPWAGDDAMSNEEEEDKDSEVQYEESLDEGGSKSDDEGGSKSDDEGGSKIDDEGGSKIDDEGGSKIDEDADVKGTDDECVAGNENDAKTHEAAALCSDVCDSILSLRKYYESQKQHIAIHPEHPWVFFIQWYRGKAYHMKYKPDPFDSPELYNVTTPSIKTAKYDIMFFRHGDLINATMSSLSSQPYVLCYDRIGRKYESYFLYSEEREDAMNSLKTWVSTAEGTYDKGAKVAALSMSPIEEISDISKYNVNDKFPHMWALFLQYFVGAALDISTCTRAVKPLERLFSDGIIYGSGYVIRFDDENRVVYLDDTQYAIYGENAFDNLDALKRRVRELELM